MRVSRGPRRSSPPHTAAPEPTSHRYVSAHTPARELSVSLRFVALLTLLQTQVTQSSRVSKPPSLELKWHSLVTRGVARVRGTGFPILRPFWRASKSPVTRVIFVQSPRPDQATTPSLDPHASASGPPLTPSWSPSWQASLPPPIRILGKAERNGTMA